MSFKSLINETVFQMSDWPLTFRNVEKFTKKHGTPNWEGKKAVLTLTDENGNSSEVIEFPITSLAHYLAVKRFVDLK